MRKTIKLILIILCMMTIFMFSSDSANESSKKSDGLIIKTCETVLRRKLTSYEKEKYVSKLEFIVRKSAHLFIYLILGLLVISYFKEINLINNKGILIAFMICFLYACSDEIHQYFVPGRSCELRDVLIDSTGSLIGIYIYNFIYSVRRRLHE